MLHLLSALVVCMSLGAMAAPGYLGGAAPLLDGHSYGYAHAPASYSYGHGYGHGYGLGYGHAYAHAPALPIAKVAAAPALAYSAPLAKYAHATYAHAPLAHAPLALGYKSYATHGYPLAHSPALPLGYGHPGYGHLSLGHAPALIGHHAPALAYSHDSHAW